MDNSATIDWNEVTITSDNPNMNISFGTKKSYVGETDDKFLLGWVDNSNFSTGPSVPPGGYVISNAYTNSSKLFASAYVSYGGFAHADAGRQAYFEIYGGNGNVTIQAPYSLIVKMQASSPGDTSYGYSFAALYMENMNSHTLLFHQSDYTIVNSITYSDLSWEESHFGILSVTLPYNNGNVIHFSMGVHSNSQGYPVPEPATMLLLGSGLIGLAGYGRKKLFKK